MIKNQRQQQILNFLDEKEIVTVTDLAEKLSSSCMTIRRDFEYLEQIGIVRRIHGGAVLLKSDNSLPTYVERLEKYQEEKNAIGKAALAFINPESIVCIDAGTTTQAMIQHIPEDLQFTVITSGIMTAAALCRFHDLEIIQVGGSVHHASYTVCNSLATDFIRKFNADIAFLSTRAFSVDKGTYESSMNLVEEKRALVSISKRVVLLADHTKFQGRSLCLAVPLEEIDVIITDNKAPNDALEQLRYMGKEVIVVEPEI